MLSVRLHLGVLSDGTLKAIRGVFVVFVEQTRFNKLVISQDDEGPKSEALIA